MAADYEAAFDAFKEIMGIPYRGGCIFHFKYNLWRRTKELRLAPLYKDKDLTFYQEWNYLVHCVNLPDDEREEYFSKQSQILIECVPPKYRRRLAIRQFIKYFDDTWNKKKINREATNFWVNVEDMTNNLIEIINKWFGQFATNGKMTFDVVLSAVQKMLALSALKFWKLRQYSSGEIAMDANECFNRGSMERRHQKKTLLELKANYDKLPKPRTFDQQKKFVRNVHTAMKGRFDKLLLDAPLLFDCCDEDEPETKNDDDFSEPEYLQQPQKRMKVHIPQGFSQVEKTAVFNALMDDLLNVGRCEDFLAELLRTDHLKNCIPASVEGGEWKGRYNEQSLQNCSILSEDELRCNWTNECDGSVFFIRGKDRKMAYPVVVVTVQWPHFLFFSPYQLKWQRSWKPWQTKECADYVFYA